MQPDEDTTITLADFTGPTTDQGGAEYEQYISPDAPDHDPFGDYPDVAETFDPSLFAIPMEVAATLAHNLAVRRQKIWACWGNGVVVGWIADAAHQGTCSDHNKDASGVVHAIDPMVTGARAQAIVNESLAHHGDLQYVIHNRVIWSVTVGWAARKYTGSNPHTDHVHISGKHGGSHGNGATCTGYDLAAQNSAPAFNPCPAPKPPAPKPPVKPATHAPGTRVLKSANPDMSGPDVTFVQRFIGAKHAGAADGVFGPKTEAGVRWYQGMRGIKVTGQVDAKTWAQMGVRWQG
jgi:hypothetical protein